MNRWLLLLGLLVVGLSVAPASAHEVRPAYLEISELPGGRADILWKQPSIGTLAVALRPRIEGGLIDRRPDEVRASDSFSIAIWRNVALNGRSLDGRNMHVEGLDRTITDVLVVVRFADGASIDRILTPSAPRFTIDARAGVAVSAYLLLGIEHILAGIDHLLFVLGLILLSRRLRILLITISAFTVAHSITLALTALGLLTINPQLIEALVALSILFVAVELIRQARGQDGVTQRYPWLIAFAFGLLHGAAFAGALKDIGLPADNIPAALFLFNLGVEIGQLLFVFAVCAAIAGARRLRLSDRAPALVRTAITYAIGGFSMFWLIERLDAALLVAS